MLGSVRTWFLCPVLVWSTGCSSLPRPHDSDSNSGPKVLFEWAEKKPKEGNDQSNEGNGSKKAQDEETKDEIVTDRPDFTEASSTVGKGRVQLESGYTFFRDRSNGERFQSHSYPEALFRVGVFADWLELRLGQNFSNEQTELPDGSRVQANGANDLYLGVKLGLTEQKEWRPEAALVLQMTAPSGSPDLSAHEVLPGANLLYGWDITNRLSVGASSQTNRARSEFEIPSFMGLEPVVTSKHSYLLLAQSLTVNYALTPKLVSYTEWFAFFPHSAMGPDIGPEHYLDGGFSYKVTPDSQLDIRAGVGLNQRATDFFAGSGFAIRY